jgi:hypothetical protein
MKKLLIVLVLPLLLVGCGKSSELTTSTEVETETPATTTSGEEATEDTTISQNEEGENVYTHPEYHYTIAFPSDWEKATFNELIGQEIPGGDSPLFFPTSAKGLDANANTHAVSVLVGPAEGKTLLEFLEMAVTTSESNPNVEVLSQTDATVSGLEGKEISTTIMAPNPVTQELTKTLSRSFVVIKDDFVYIIEHKWGEESPELEKYNEIVNTMVASFQLTAK